MNTANDKRLFWACFIALVATAFGFIVRAMIINGDTAFAAQFGLSETQKGEIFGVGLWPFAISIVLFSLVIDRIGYGPAMVFAFFCHVASMIITVCAPMVLAPPGSSPEQVAAGQKTGYWMLYLGNFIVALGNGTVEAVINPVVATMFSKEKSKWLSILHAGWPGGLVLGGLLALGMDTANITDWRLKVGLLALPVVLYGILMLFCTFPVNERVAAGVSFREMLSEVGALSAFVISALIVFEVTRVFEGMGLIFTSAGWSEVLTTVGPFQIDQKTAVKYGITLAAAVLFGLWSGSLGRILFFFLVVIMIPLATTELGIDSWITGLMETEMKLLGLPPILVLIYTSAIMMVLRLFASGWVVRTFRGPLGVLAVSSAVAAVSLVSLSTATGVLILAAATLYGLGKTYFWPMMLGVVSEQFPKGGALTLNLISGVGMLGVGVIGNPLLGNLQDKEIDRALQQTQPALHAKVMGETKQSVFGSYRALDTTKVEAVLAKDAPDDAKIQTALDTVKEEAKKSALYNTAIFPVFMLISYVLMIFYFQLRGGYKAQSLGGDGGGH